MWGKQSCLRAGFRRQLPHRAEAGTNSPASKQDCLPHIWPVILSASGGPMKRMLFFLLSTALLPAQRTEVPKIEDWKGKTILVFTPHPDDDTFGCGGTLALLAKNGNRIFIAIYTNDDKGSYDLDMNSQRLAVIRKAEEESACSTLGIPKENILWMGHHDGMLEYVNSLAQALSSSALRMAARRW